MSELTEASLSSLLSELANKGIIYLNHSHYPEVARYLRSKNVKMTISEYREYVTIELRK